jgi:hypothetical protein
MRVSVGCLCMRVYSCMCVCVYVCMCVCVCVCQRTCVLAQAHAKQLGELKAKLVTAEAEMASLQHTHQLTSSALQAEKVGGSVGSGGLSPRSEFVDSLKHVISVSTFDPPPPHTSLLFPRAVKVSTAQLAGRKQQLELERQQLDFELGQRQKQAVASLEALKELQLKFDKCSSELQRAKEEAAGIRSKTEARLQELVSDQRDADQRGAAKLQRVWQEQVALLKQDKSALEERVRVTARPQ